MARLNTHPSATPQPARSSTVDSLYRDPTPTYQQNGGSTARQSSYSVISPAQSMTSDKENDTSALRVHTPQPRGKGKARDMAGSRPQRLLTPDSKSLDSPNKRRRTASFDPDEASGSQIPIFEDQTPEEDEDEDEEEEEDEGEDGDDENRFYDPHQNPDKRRQVRLGFRNMQRELEDNRDEYIQPGNNMLEEAIPRATRMFGKVRQTADAVLDSNVLVTMTDLSGKRLRATLHGNSGVGVDVDQFVSRCIYFMKEGHPPGADEEAAATQSRGPRQTQHEDDEEDSGEGLDWAFLGRNACFSSIKRPPVSSFLLGPLSVQKRARAVQTRRARSQRQPLGPATRPQEIRQEDIKQSENSNVTNLVTSIGKRLKEHLDAASAEANAEIAEYGDDVDAEAESAACRRHRVYQDPETNEPAVSLFDFAVNPMSFGQTVENLFYISFLIREGVAKVFTDDDGLPLLVPEKPRTIDEQREQNVAKNQAIFSIDWPTWQALIEAFDIRKPLIPHRTAEETDVAAGSWYG